MICPTGVRSISISACGNSPEFGNRSMLLCDEICVFRWDGKPNRVRLFSTVNRSKPVPFVAMSAGTMREKKIQGRKRFLLVDTQGLVMSVKVLAADFGE